MHRRIPLVIAVAMLSFALAGCESKGDKAGARLAVEKTAKTAETRAPATQAAPGRVFGAKSLAYGKEHFRHGRFEESLRDFSAAIWINPGYDSAYVYQGMALTKLKRPAEALPSLDKAIELAKKGRGANSEWLAWPHYQKGVALLELRQVDAAFAELDASIRLKPLPGALAARGNAYLMQGQSKSRAGDMQSARQYFLAAGADVDRGISMSGDNGRLWSLKSSVHFMLDEASQACKAARKACELGNCGMIEEFSECKEGGS